MELTGAQKWMSGGTRERKKILAVVTGLRVVSIPVFRNLSGIIAEMGFYIYLP